ncbi:hypothetical protein [Rathayibacter sp. SD072]|uniref:hypothetical protein n=1 Tax=Rathayibacter sp. SD072 TaxID=2781731 RepID=UPI001F62491F|nr:hypothetical protein [Rathayibacter sp. SD072]
MKPTATPTSTPTAVPPMANPKPPQSGGVVAPVVKPRGPSTGLASTGADGVSLALTATLALAGLLGGAALMISERRRREQTGS